MDRINSRMGMTEINVGKEIEMISSEEGREIIRRK